MRNRILKAAAQFLATGLTTWLLMSWLGGRQHFLYVWPLTAMQLAIVLKIWRDPASRYLQLAGGALGMWAACQLLGIPWWIAASMALVEMVEVWVAGAILSRTVATFDDLKRRSNVLRFSFISLLLPAAAMSFAAIPIAALTRHTYLATWQIVAPADALGLAIIVPALLFCISGEYRHFHKLKPHLIAAGPALVLFLGVAIAIFAQKTNPFLFMVFPPLILVVFVLGLEGAVFALPALTFVACLATANGSGPIWIRAELPLEQRIFILQLFLCTAAAVALSVGALLDERRRVGRQAEEAQSIYQTLIQHAEDMIILSSLDAKRRFVSPAVQKITGWTPEEFLAMGPIDVVHPADRDLARTVLESLTAGKMHHTFRFRVVCRDGSYRWVEAFLRGYRQAESSEIAGYVSTVRDISELKLTEESWLAERAAMAHQNNQLADLASRDELTGIPNRRAFNRVLDHEAARHGRTDKPLSLLMLDVDYFKKFNDRYGHPAGDVCLQRLAQALQGCVRRSSDMVARVGGEEFAVLLPATDEEGARKLAQKMIRAVQSLHIEHAESPLGRVSISIGISIWPAHYTTEPSHLIQQADRALYESKSRGRNCISIADDLASISLTGQE